MLSFSYPYGKQTSSELQQQQKLEGKGESEAAVRSRSFPPGHCWCLGWERWEALRVSSKAGAAEGGRDGSRKRAAGSRKLAATSPGIPVRWKLESRFLRCAGSASAPSSACARRDAAPAPQPPCSRVRSKALLGGFSSQGGMRPSNSPEDGPGTGTSSDECAPPGDTIVPR